MIFFSRAYYVEVANKTEETLETEISSAYFIVIALIVLMVFEIWCNMQTKTQIKTSDNQIKSITSATNIDTGKGATTTQAEENEPVLSLKNEATVNFNIMNYSSETIPEPIEEKQTVETPASPSDLADQSPNCEKPLLSDPKFKNYAELIKLEAESSAHAYKKFISSIVEKKSLEVGGHFSLFPLRVDHWMEDDLRSLYYSLDESQKKSFDTVIPYYKFGSFFAVEKSDDPNYEYMLKCRRPYFFELFLKEMERYLKTGFSVQELKPIISVVEKRWFPRSVDSSDGEIWFSKQGEDALSEYLKLFPPYYLNVTEMITQKKYFLFEGEPVVYVSFQIDFTIPKENECLSGFDKKLYYIANDKRVSSELAGRDFDKLTGEQFEQYCADLLKRNGYKDIQMTKSSGDQGIDIIGKRDSVRYGIQCKCYSNDVGNDAIQEALAGKSYYGCHVAVVFTNSYFTKSAISLANKTGVVLWDRTQLEEFIANAQTDRA